jgi:hypothetical protein
VPGISGTSFVWIGGNLRAREGLARNVGLQTIKAAIEKAVIQRG